MKPQDNQKKKGRAIFLTVWLLLIAAILIGIIRQIYHDRQVKKANG